MRAVRSKVVDGVTGKIELAREAALLVFAQQGERLVVSKNSSITLDNTVQVSFTYVILDVKVKARIETCLHGRLTQ
jgi:hypothetical protein